MSEYSKIVGKKVLIEPLEENETSGEILLIDNKPQIGRSMLAKVIDYNDDLLPEDLKEIGFNRGKIIRHDGNAFQITLGEKDYLMTGFNHVVWIYN